MRFHALALVSVIVPCALAACSDDATSSSTTTTVDGGATSSPDAGPVAPTDGGEPPATDAAPDAPSGPAIRCTQAEFDKVAGAGGGDFTGFPGADISFFFTGAPQQYVNHCVKVKVGSDATHAGGRGGSRLTPTGRPALTPPPPRQPLW